MTLVFRHSARALSWLFLGLGALLLIGSGALWGFERWVEAQSPPAVTSTFVLPPTYGAIPPEALDADAASALAVISQSSFRRPPKALEPATRIVIPKINVDSKIVELGLKQVNGEWVWETPAYAVGHLIGTGMPGGDDNIVMAGHISSPLSNEGNVFQKLPDLNPGDSVVLYVGEKARVYRVSNKFVVLPNAIEVIAPTPSETLTLITCYPDLIYTHRMIVQALPVSGNEDF